MKKTKFKINISFEIDTQEYFDSVASTEGAKDIIQSMLDGYTDWPDRSYIEINTSPV